MSVPILLVAAAGSLLLAGQEAPVDDEAARIGTGPADRAALVHRLIQAVDDLMGDPPAIVVEVTREVWPTTPDGLIGDAPTDTEHELIRWRGGQWLLQSDGDTTVGDGERMWRVSPRSRSVSTSGLVKHSDEQMLEVFLQREGFAGWSAVPTLAAELRECDVVRIELEGGVIRCEYTLPRSREVMAHPRLRVVELAPGPPIRLLTFALAAWNPATEKWGTPMRYFATDWADLDGRPLPRVVERYREGHTSLIRRTLLSARIADVHEAATWTFAPPREPGWTVRDSRLRLEFVTGERIVTVAGKRYRLAEPLMEHPGDALAELLGSAEVLDGAAQ